MGQIIWKLLSVFFFGNIRIFPSDDLAQLMHFRMQDIADRARGHHKYHAYFWLVA